MQPAEYKTQKWNNVCEIHNEHWTDYKDHDSHTWSAGLLHLQVQCVKRKLTKWKNSICKSGIACTIRKKQVIQLNSSEYNKYIIERERERMTFQKLKFINETDCNAEENPQSMHQTHQQKECTQIMDWMSTWGAHIYFMKL